MKPFRKVLHKIQIKRNWLYIISAVVLGCFFLLMMFSNVTTKMYDVEIYDQADETIRSPITIENQAETERQRREALQGVEDRYVVSDQITAENVQAINEVFTAISRTDTSEEDENQVLEEVRGLLTESINEGISDDVLLQLMDSSAEEREIAQNTFTEALTEVMDSGVREDELEAAKDELAAKLQYTDISQNMKQAMEDLANFAVVQNASFDTEETMEARMQAQNSVEPVMIRAGEVIVREGETITSDVYDQLQLVGLLNNDRNVLPVIGVVMLSLLLTGFLFYEWFNSLHIKEQPKPNITMVFVLIISIVSVLLLKIVSLITSSDQHIYLLLPAAAGAILLKQLVNTRFANCYAIGYAVLGGMILNDEIPGSLNMEAALYFLFTQLAAVYFTKSVKDRVSLIRGAAGIMVVQAASVLIFLFFAFEKYSVTIAFLYMGYAAVSALLSVILTAGILPFIETGLGVVSDMKLLALSKPNHPLLRKILTEAPGTYHHSVMVANLSEAACEAVGANGLLARVAAYYHDIGKTIRPQLFIENQMGRKNPHDRLSPRQSANIIISHPYDGAALLEKHKFPQEVVAIAKEHHGTSLLKFFYHKEKECNNTVSESQYRYPGPKPSSSESAIISICDSVEAAVRSLKEPTDEKIDSLVDAIINSKLTDGQLDNTPLTLKDLTKIKEAICETLKGIFHSRIEYPDDKKVKEAK